MIAEIQCLPRPSGTDDDQYAFVHAAIELIEQSGLVHEVSALGTTLEGDPDEVWPLLRAVHEACLAAGADSAITIVKVAETAGAAPTTMADLTRRYR